MRLNWVILVPIAGAIISGCDGPGATVSSETPVNPSPSVSHAHESHAGKDLHASILARYPDVSSWYQRPILWGAGTREPLVVLSVPEEIWLELSENDRELIGSYAASLVDVVKKNPFDYTDIPSTAPAATIIRQNVARMTYGSWGILVGNISEDGQDILADRITVRGN